MRRRNLLFVFLIVIFLSNSLFARWTTTVALTDNLGSSYLSHNNSRNFVIEDGEKIHLVWYDWTPYPGFSYTPQVFYKFYTPQNGWGTDTCISDVSSERAFYPAIALDSSGNLHLIYSVYQESPSRYYLRYKKKALDGRWLSSEKVDSSSHFISNPAIAVFPDARIGVVYTKRNGSPSYYQIFYREKTADTWRAITQLTFSPQHKYNPSIAVTNDFFCHIVWDGREPGMGENKIFYISRSPAGVWSPIAPVTPASWTRPQFSPMITADASNRVHITWYGYHPTAEVYYRIYYRRHEGGSFNEIDTVAGGNQTTNYFRFFPNIALDKENNINLVWCGQEEGVLVYKIWHRKRSGNIWDSIRQIPCGNPTGSVYLPQIVGLNSNHLHICFYDLRKGNPEIFWTTTQPYDVGATEIISPGSYILPGRLVPTVKVKNFANAYHRFYAQAEIFDSLGQRLYIDSQAVSLPGLDSVNLGFRETYLFQLGSYKARFIVNLRDDIFPHNDTISLQFFVGRFDIAVSAILSPVGIIPYNPSNSISVQAAFKNLGQIPVSFWAYFKIREGNEARYFDSLYIVSLRSGEERVVNFAFWVTDDSGSFSNLVYSGALFDENRANDTLKRDFFILVPGMQTWLLLRGMPFAPSNKKIGDGTALTTVFDTLIYALKGGGTADFYYYNTSKGHWFHLPSVPRLPGAKKDIKKGASMAFDGEKFIYLIKGNNSREFWRFNIFSQSFEPLLEVPGEKMVKGGASLGFFSNKLYLLKGTNTKEFYAFDTVTKTWLTNLAPPPTKKGFKEGSGIAISHTDSVIYLLQAKTNLFLRYSIKKDTWESLPPLPLSHPATRQKKKVKSGGGLTVKDDFVYAIKGGSTYDFFCYNPATRTWLPLETIPKGPYRRAIKGGAITSNSIGVYILKGRGSDEFWLWIGLPPKESDFFSTAIQPNKNIMSEESDLILKNNRSIPIKIYDVNGRLIAFLKQRGSKTIKQFPSGIYFINDGTRLRKIVRLK